MTLLHDLPLALLAPEVLRPLSHSQKINTTDRLACRIYLVRQCDLTWNPIYDSILLMHQKLRDLGFEYQDGKIVANEADETYPP